jgi:hypothetical protein
MYAGLHVKYPLFVSDFNETSIFMIDFRKITQNFTKILRVGAVFFSCREADGRTDMTKLIVAFCNFANPPKKQTYLTIDLKRTFTLFRKESAESDSPVLFFFFFSRNSAILTAQIYREISYFRSFY